MLSRGINFSILYFFHLKEFKIVILLEITLLSLIWLGKLDSLLGFFGIPSRSTYDMQINEREEILWLSLVSALTATEYHHDIFIKKNIDRKSMLPLKVYDV